jgi:hypothetical protein
MLIWGTNAAAVAAGVCGRPFVAPSGTAGGLTPRVTRAIIARATMAYADRPDDADAAWSHEPW